MVKSAKSALEEEVYDDRELHATNYGSSHSDGRGSGQQPPTPRSKHSATEQRRRSKINESVTEPLNNMWLILLLDGSIFITPMWMIHLKSLMADILRDLIPQNDQKRDKASFLLEVIEYIQFLKEKLNMYEGSFQAWGQEPPRLMPWRDNHGPQETYIDRTQVITNGSAQENNVVTPIITNTQNLVESDISLDAAYRVLDHSHGPPIQTSPQNVILQPNLFSPGGKGGLPMHLPQGSLLDAEHMVAQAQCQLDQGKPCASECAVPSNPLQEQDFTSESKLVSISNAYSQGVLHTLIQALQSSGVDISQASISVQIDVGKQTHGGQNATAYGAQDHKNPSPCNQSMPHSLVGTYGEDSDQAFKRIRR